jgi:hypothetical protein
MTSPELLRLMNALPSCSSARDRVKALPPVVAPALPVLVEQFVVVVEPEAFVAQNVVVVVEPVVQVSVLVPAFASVTVLQDVPGFGTDGANPSTGASTMGVGWMLDPDARSTLAITPGLVAVGAVVRYAD